MAARNDAATKTITLAIESEQSQTKTSLLGRHMLDNMESRIPVDDGTNENKEQRTLEHIPNVCNEQVVHSEGFNCDDLWPFVGSRIRRSNNDTPDSWWDSDLWSVFLTDSSNRHLETLQLEGSDESLMSEVTESRKLDMFPFPGSSAM